MSSAVAHKTIKKYAYILHDKDVKQKETEGHASYKIGDKIGNHYHIAIKCDDAVEISKIAKWFGVPENFVEVISGANAYIDCVEYLTHEHPTQQAKGKFRYPDDEVKSNHDWRKELDLYQIRRAKKGSSKLNTKEYYRNEVLYLQQLIGR